MAVVGDLDQVIQTHTFRNNGVFQRAAINTGVSADFNVIPDDHATQLRNLLPPLRAHDIPEASGPDDRTGLYLTPGAQYHAVTNGNAGNQPTVFAKNGLIADDAVWPDKTVRAYLRSATDDRTCTEMHAFANKGVWGHTRSRVHSGLKGAVPIKQPCDTGKRQPRVTRDQRRTGHCVGKLLGNNDGGGQTTRQLLSQPRAAHIADAARLSGVQAACARNPGISVATQFEFELRGDIT